MTDRKQHWEQVYTNKSSLEVSWYQAEPRLSLDLIHRSGIGREASIIDVGGGASLLVGRLQADGYKHLAVLDISAAALATARQRIGPKAAEIKWYESDVTQFTAPHAFTLWHDRAVFHFLTAAEGRRRYVEVLKRTLGPDFRLEEELAENHRTPAGKDQKFGFFRLRRIG